jgi:hypothetical protein
MLNISFKKIKIIILLSTISVLSSFTYLNRVNYKIELNVQGLKINNSFLPPISKLKDIIKVFGKPSRSFINSEEEIIEKVKKFGTKPSDIYVYDELGIYFYEDIDTKTITSLDIDFIVGDFSFSPYKTFKEELIIADKQITANSIENDFKQIKDVEIFPTQFYTKYLLSKSEFTAHFVTLGKSKVVRSVSLKIGQKKQNTLLTNGWEKETLTMLKTSLKNNETVIKLTNERGININEFANCYIEKITKNYTQAETEAKTTELQPVFQSFMKDCFQSLTK